MDHAPGRYDLRALMRAVGGPVGAGTTDPDDRGGPPEEPAELIDSHSLRVDSEPLAVSGYVDGIQNQLVLTYRDHRPVYLTFTAAASVNERGSPGVLRERLRVCATPDDAAWLRDRVVDPPPFEELPPGDPPAVEAAAVKSLSAQRDQLERSLVADLVDDDPHGAIVVDGSVASHTPDARVVGVAKTVATRYLDDESVLWHLPQGWRSPRFRLPERAGGVERYSCYVRMVDASRQRWSHGLVRLEAHDPDLLEPLAARCLSLRQTAAGGDPRWAVHLAPVAACERFLRARRPAAFEVGLP